MTFLLDENISYRLVKLLAGVGISSIHVSKSGIHAPVTDQKIWRYAKKNRFVIITFDEDFHLISGLKGFPPKIILLKFGNTPTLRLFTIISENLEIIQRFVEDDTLGILEVY